MVDLPLQMVPPVEQTFILTDSWQWCRFLYFTLDTILSLNEAKSVKEVETLIRTVSSKLHDLES